MRVGFIIYGGLEILSGGYLYDRKLVEYLHNQGDHVEIISLAVRDYPRHLTDNLSGQLLSRITGAHLDILLQDELNHPSLFWMNRRLQKRGYQPAIIAIVHHLRTSESHRKMFIPLYKWIEGFYLKTINGFVYNSQTTRRAVEKFAGPASAAIVAHPAGDRFNSRITYGEIERRAYQPGPLKLIFIGNLIPRKGLHFLLRSLALLPPESFRLTVVGGLDMDKAYVTKIQKLIERSGNRGQVSMLGSVGTKQLAEQFISHHLLVVPSNYEGFGIVYLEGMGFGLPSIATDSGAAAETITNGSNGFLVQPGATEELAQRIQQLYQNRAQLAEMSVTARGYFLAAPTWEDTCTRIYTFLQRMATRDERTGSV